MTEPYCKALHSNLLKRSVIVMVGEFDEAMHRAFLKELYDYAKPKVLKDSWAEVLKRQRGVWEEKHYQGVTIHFEGDVYIHMPKWKSEVFVHEAYHATQFIMSDLSAEDEEVAAFVIEWIFGEICLGDRRPGAKESK